MKKINLPLFVDVKNLIFPPVVLEIICGCRVVTHAIYMKQNMAKITGIAFNVN